MQIVNNKQPKNLNTNRSLIFLVLVIGSLLVYLAYYFLTTSPINSPNNPSNTPLEKSLDVVKEKLDPFSDMTIPHLRNRSYKSSLGDIKEVNSNSRYTSYLTSYNSDELKINGLLTKPTTTMPQGGWPAIVFVHGYIPPTLYRSQEKYVAYVDYLAKNGFVVFKIDLRGHDKSEGTPGGAYYSPDYVIDTLNAYAALQNTTFINPQKIGLWGHSMAGNVVLRASATNPQIPATSIWAGAGFTFEDLQTYRLNDQSYRPPTNNTLQQKRRSQLFEKHGQFSSSSEFWKQVVPTNFLSDFVGAIELHHATDDPVVSVEYSRNLNNMLDKTNIPHQFYEYSNGGHNLSDPSFSKAIQRTVDFFQKYLN